MQKAIAGGSKTVYIYDAFGLASEYTNGSWSKDYIREGGGTLIATENASGPCRTCYLSYDLLGSVRAVMDGNGNVVARHDFLPFGEEIQANTAGRDAHFGSTTDVSQKFTGQIRDQESGMDFFNARYFTAALDRFNSPDPGNAGADLSNPQTLNGYAYVGNNPLQMTDPSGMDSIGSGDGGYDPCLEDPFLCDAPPPILFPNPPQPPPPPPIVTESAGGNPLPPGSFPGGETLGLPPGFGLPGVSQFLSSLFPFSGCEFGACLPQSGAGFGYDNASPGVQPPTVLSSMIDEFENELAYGARQFALRRLCPSS